jgi:release factor glutamine methyltransferase
VPETAAPATVSQLLSRATGRLADAGCDTPRLDTELLLAEVLGVTRTGLYLAAPGTGLDDAQSGAFEALIARRVEREPVAYILGHREFRRISLAVDRRVLIPRPETELLVEVGLSLDRGARVVDVGTGSGAVVLALKDERPDLDVSATDISADALAVARANAARLGLEVRFAEGELACGGVHDAVLANLPYVEPGSELAPEIARYEPAPAIWGGGPDGLEVVRRLVRTLAGTQLVGLEIGAGQAGAVAELLGAAGFRSVQRLSDLAGHERVLVGRR